MTNTKRSVVHLVTSLDFGGVEKHVEIMAKHAKDSRYHPSFWAIAGGGATEQLLRDMGLEVVCLGLNPKIPNFSAIYTLTSLLLRNRPTVVHTHGAEANFHGLLAAWLSRVQVRIGEEIGIPNHSNKAKLAFRFVYHTAHHVIGISTAVTQWLIAAGEVSPAKITRIYNPVDLPTPDVDPPSINDVFRIGFVGRLEPVKNPGALLDAFNIFQKSISIRCELWFVGEGSERDALENSICQKGLTDKVKLLGYQPDPVKFLRQCHIYVQPSLSEGFGLALVEAMGCGIPVISTAVGGAPEIIDHGKTGWLIPISTPELIVDALKTAWQLGPEKLREMGRCAQQSVNGRFEPIHYLAQTEQLYSNIAVQCRDR